MASLLLGGSAQGAWQNALLQLAGLAIIAWAAASPSAEKLPKAAMRLGWLVVAGLIVVGIQLIPLPGEIWHSGLRARLLNDYSTLAHPAPMLPISLTPYGTLDALLRLIPPIALFCAMLRLRAFRPSWLAAALLGGGVAGIILGALQVASAGANSHWYLYSDTNRGWAVGFFANANHMADLLVITLPFLAALAAAGRSRNIQRYSALLVILAAAALLVVAGIALNGSLAGYGLAIPVLVASVLVIAPPSRSFRLFAALFAAVSVVAAMAAIYTTSIGSSQIGSGAKTSVQSRQQILQFTGRAIRDTMPFGSGLGSFVNVYPLYESADSVTREYVVHAHNDYAELILELGAAGVAVILAFLVWWASAVRSTWRTGGSGAYARAASIASAAILLHSLVDFPLRTAAISTAFAMCLALLADRRPAERQEPNDLRPTRHLIIH